MICIVIFGATVVALLGYVYLSTAAFVHGRSDQAIAADDAILQQAYADAGRAGLIAAMARHIGDDRFEGGVYLLVDASFRRLAGNLEAWPPALAGGQGFANFSAPEWKPEATHRPLLRAKFEALAEGERLLVGRDIDDLQGFVQNINAALALTISLILILAGVASLQVTRRTVGRIEAINAASRAIMR